MDPRRIRGWTASRRRVAARGPPPLQPQISRADASSLTSRDPPTRQTPPLSASARVFLPFASPRRPPANVPPLIKTARVRKYPDFISGIPMGGPDRRILLTGRRCVRAPPWPLPREPFSPAHAEFRISIIYSLHILMYNNVEFFDQFILFKIFVQV